MLIVLLMAPLMNVFPCPPTVIIPPEVARVMHPGLPDDPGHGIWKRDFAGASGLFGIVLTPCAPAALAAMLDRVSRNDLPTRDILLHCELIVRDSCGAA